MNKTLVHSIKVMALPLALLTLAGGCKETDPNKPAYWLQIFEDTRDKDPQNKNEALQKLGELKDVNDLRKILTSKEKLQFRARAASALAATGDKSVAGDLVSMLDFSVGTGTDQRSKDIRRANEKIIEALGILKAKEGVEPAIRLLDADDPIVRKAACRALGNIGDASAVEALAHTAMEDDNANICRTAVEALGDIGDKSAIPVLIKALFVERKSSLYPYASYALYQVGQDAIPALLDLLDGKNAEINKLAEQYNYAPGVIEIKAIEVLGDFRAAGFEDRLLKLYEKYDSAKEEDLPLKSLLKRSIVMALEKNGGAKAAQMLAEAVIDEDDYSVREIYASAINSISDRSVAESLLQAANTGDADAKRVVIKAYTQLAEGKDLASLDNFAKNGFKSSKGDLNAAVKRIVTNERIRLEAAKECAADVGCWVGKMTDQNSRVRNKAAYELGRLSKVGQVDAKVVKALVNATGDDDEDVRRAAIWALFRLKDASGVDDMAKIVARDAGRPDYYRVNEDLKRLIIFLKWQTK